MTRTTRLLWVCFVTTFSGLTGNTALACSLTRDYVRPSNFELVGMQDAIVVAKAVRRTLSAKNRSGVMFKVESVLKGEVPETVNDNWGNLGRPQSSDPDDLRSANPEAYSGACNRHTYKKDSRYVLFLSKSKDGSYDVNGPALTRINEDYFGENSLWVQTVKFYIEVQQSHSPMQQLEKLRQRYEEIIATSFTEDEGQLAYDIARHVLTPSPYKPTDYLLQTYSALEQGDEHPFMLNSPSSKIDFPSDNDHAPWTSIDDLTSSWQKIDYTKRFEKQNFILWSLVLGAHPKAMPLLEKLSQDPLQRGSILGPTLRYFTEHDRYHRAIELANAHTFRILNNAPKDDVMKYMRGAIKLAGFEMNGERHSWQSDDRARVWWPDFAMALNTSLGARFGEDHPFNFFPGAALVLRPIDYRTRPDVAWVLAENYDDEVVDWAEKEVQIYIESKEDLGRHFLDLPIEILLLKYRSSVPESVERIDRYFCTNKRARYTIISRLGLIQNYNTKDLLFRIARYEGLSGHEPTYLLQTIAMFVGISTRDFLLGNGRGISETEDLLKAYAKGDLIEIDEREQEDRRPIVCPQSTTNG